MDEFYTSLVYLKYLIVLELVIEVNDDDKNCNRDDLYGETGRSYVNTNVDKKRDMVIQILWYSLNESGPSLS